MKITTKVTIRAFLSIVLLIALSGSMLTEAVFAAGLYKWTDAHGVVHFSTKKPTDGNRADLVGLRQRTNVVLPDSENQFVGLARLTAPSLCRGRNRQSCIDSQVSAARAVGQMSDRPLQPRERFHLQTCQQRHMLSKSRKPDFVALRACIGTGG